MVPLAALAIVLLLAAAAAAFVLARSKATAVGQQDATSAADEVAVGPRAARRRDAQARLRGNQLRHRAQAAAAAAAGPARAMLDSDEEGSGSEEEEGSGAEDAEGRRGKKSKKQRNREARREAAEAERAARQEREARMAKGSAYDEIRRRKDEEREAQEAAQEEEMRRAAEERARKEEAEAAKWMRMISVQEEGTDAADDAVDASAALNNQLVEYIQGRKTVPLEQLATDFKLRTSDVIDRINGLETLGQLTGVMDDRGKYIYIPREEMQAVAAYLQQKGRVAISDLAARSSTLIDLEPKAATATALHSGSALDFESILDE